MFKLLCTAVTPVWALLMVATGVSWWLGTVVGHSTVIIMTISFFKCFLVGMFFMELIHAPQPLRVVFSIWCTIGLLGILGIYLFA